MHSHVQMIFVRPWGCWTNMKQPSKACQSGSLMRVQLEDTEKNTRNSRILIHSSRCSSIHDPRKAGSRTFNWRVIEEVWCNIVHLRHSAGWSSIGFNYRVHDLRTLHRFKKPFRDSETRETRTLSAAGRGAMVDMLQETMRVGLDHLKKTPWFEGMEGYFETCFGPKTYRHYCTCFQFFVQTLWWFFDDVFWKGTD